MNDPLVLLVLLNIIPSSLRDIEFDLLSLKQGKATFPAGGSNLVRRSLRDSVEPSGPFDHFSSTASCVEGLRALTKAGLVKQDRFGYQLTYAGVIIAAEVVRSIQQQYKPPVPEPTLPPREVDPQAVSKPDFSPLSQKKIVEALVKRYAGENKN